MTTTPRAPIKAAIYLLRACLALGISLTRRREILFPVHGVTS